MKQKLLLLLLLVALGAGAYVYTNEKMLFTEEAPPPPVTTKKKVPPKKAKKPVLSQLPAIFPSGPTVWIHLKDLGKITGQIKKSNFYKQAMEYKILGSAKEKSAFSEISSQLEKKTIMDFLGQEVGIALYPPDKADTTENYLFATKISAITKIQEKLKRAKDSFFKKDVIVTESSYKEKTIITYKNQGQKYSFNYVIIKDYLLASSSDTLLKKGIDTMEAKESDRFINSEGFNSIFKTSDLFMEGLIFTDIEKMDPNIFNNLIPSKNVPPKTISDIKKLLQSFKYSGLTFKIKNGVEIKSTVTINKEKADEEWLQAIKIEPRKLKSLNFMPATALVSGAIVFEPSYSFEQITKKLKEKEGAKKTFEDFFSKYTGVNLGKDIIPLIGNEISYTVSAQDKNAPLPIPGLTIGLEIKDGEKIKNLLNKIQTNLTKSSKQKSPRVESYEGYDINFLPVSIPVPVQPAYSIVDNFLFLSLDQKEIKRLIDTLKKKITPLEKNKNYISAKIPAKSLGMLFVNASPLWDGLSEAITKAPAGLSPTQTEMTEAGMKSLGLMRTIQSFNTVFTRENDQFNSRTFIALKDIPKVRSNKELLASLGKSKGKSIISSKSVQVQQASYGYVYDPVGKRNPFISLLKRREDIENIKTLGRINKYLFDKIRKEDRALYDKLKSHAKFFKNKTALGQLSQEERLQKVEQYRRLISIAKSDFHDTILGPLQTKYSSLKLTGIIWGKLGNVALIETGGKGFSVTANDLMGPNYGIVKSIEKNEIIVVEKYVNYVGKIIEKRQQITLSKGDESI